MNEPAVSAKSLVFAYGDHVAVNEVSLDVPVGQIVGLLGPNGAGKSTLIKMLTGQLPPASGSIRILGMQMPRQRQVIQARIGVCFEEKNLYPDMSAAENLRFFGDLYGASSVDALELLGRVGLADRVDDKVSGFSKGMRQRLMLARTLVNSPDVLFLDEPTDGLDPVSAKAIRGLIRSEADRGAAVLLTTHDMFEADELSDTVAFINDGRLLTSETPENLKLTHGSRSVRVRTRGTDGAETETVVSLDQSDTQGRLQTAMESGEVLTVHTEEATLEDIFITFAGRGLAS